MFTRPLKKEIKEYLTTRSTTDHHILWEFYKFTSASSVVNIEQEEIKTFISHLSKNSGSYYRDRCRIEMDKFLKYWRAKIVCKGLFCDIINPMPLPKVERNRALVMMREQKKLSFPKIAHQLNMHISQVYKIWKRDKKLYS